MSSKEVRRQESGDTINSSSEQEDGNRRDAKKYR